MVALYLHALGYELVLVGPPGHESWRGWRAERADAADPVPGESGRACACII
jgi:hypothetical protein